MIPWGSGKSLTKFLIEANASAPLIMNFLAVITSSPDNASLFGMIFAYQPASGDKDQPNFEPLFHETQM